MGQGGWKRHGLDRLERLEPFLAPLTGAPPHRGATRHDEHPRSIGAPLVGAVDLATNRKILGYSFWIGPGRTVKLRVAGKALTAMKDRVRRLTGRSRGRSINQVIMDLREYLPGWKLYFSLAETPGVFSALDKWIRHRLRAVHLKHWKRGRTVFRELRARGASVLVAATVAANARRWWHNSRLYLHTVLTTRYFDGLGLPRLQP